LRGKKVSKAKARPKENRDLLLYEKGLFAQGIVRVAGVDEAGRGCLAGPVFAGAVILPPDLVLPDIDDSKKLQPAVRERLFDKICRRAIAWAVAMVEADEIDRINIHRASLRAMQLAVAQLKPGPEYLLVDGRFPIPERLPQKPIVKGDQRSQTIAAASILAKVSRDRWIEEEGKKYPQFKFKDHKGYATAEHFDEIKKHGLTPLHRKTFAVVL
jgi:ribonuclease HII